MNALPPIGRVSKTGLSVKELGRNEYARQYARLHVPRKTSRRWWTGLSRKTLNNSQYAAAYRALKHQMESHAL